MGVEGCQSEVKRLRQQIELTCESMNRGLAGYAVSARHDIIQSKYRKLEMYHIALERLVGEENALSIMTETYNKVIR